MTGLAFARFSRPTARFSRFAVVSDRHHVPSLMFRTGLDETLLQTVPARHIYGPRDIIFGARLADILRPTDGGALWMIDSANFDAIIRAPLTLNQKFECERGLAESMSGEF